MAFMGRKSGKSRGILKWRLSGNPDMSYEVGWGIAG